MGAYQKALLLYDQGRYELARQELARELASEPNSARAHAMLALCLAAEDRFPEARRSAERAIALAPQLSFAHYALSWVFFRDAKYTCRRGVKFAIDAAHLGRLRLKNAEAAVREAIRLSPHEAHLFGLLALIRFDRADPRECLEAARHGLAIDPQQGDCLRAQALAIRALGDSASATAASGQAIAANPEGASEHVIHGRTLLLAGNYEQALDHFTEAMRLDPNSSYAREGLLEGLRARHRFYRCLLRLGLGYTKRRRGIWLPVLLFLSLITPVIVTVILAKHYHLADSIRSPLIRLGLIPGLCLILGKYWATFLLQFDPIGRHILTPGARRGALVFVIWMSVLAVVPGVTLLAALGMRRAAVALACLAGASAVLVLLRLIWPRRGNAARHSGGESIESDPR
jgi:tetratricopeptide (TPR) repeat protein